MSKQRVDIPPDPLDTWCVWIFHLWIINHDPLIEAHTVRTGQVRYFPDSPIENDDQLGAICLAYFTPDEAAANGLTLALEGYPDLISDKCPYCHFLANRGAKPRWNLMRGERYPYKTPCQISPDFYWHFT